MTGSDAAIAAQLRRRRYTAAAAWDLSDEFVVIGAGEPIPIPGRYDRTYPFRAHSEYFYLTDRERPGGALAFDPGEGWVEFVAPVTREELLWSGFDGAKEGVLEGARAVAELSEWLERRRGRRCGCLGAAVPGVSSDPELDEELRYALTQVRRPKDEVELARMKRAEQAPHRFRGAGTVDRIGADRTGGSDRARGTVLPRRRRSAGV